MRIRYAGFAIAVDLACSSLQSSCFPSAIQSHAATPTPPASSITSAQGGRTDAARQSRAGTAASEAYPACRLACSTGIDGDQWTTIVVASACSVGRVLFNVGRSSTAGQTPMISRFLSNDPSDLRWICMPKYTREPRMHPLSQHLISSARKIARNPSYKNPD